MTDNVIKTGAAHTIYYDTKVLKEYEEVCGLSVQAWEMTPKAGGPTCTHVVILGTANGWDDVLIFEGHGGEFEVAALLAARTVHNAALSYDQMWFSNEHFGTLEIVGTLQ